MDNIGVVCGVDYGVDVEVSKYFIKYVKFTYTYDR